jgi:hypothetical protein
MGSNAAATAWRGEYCAAPHRPKSSCPSGFPGYRGAEIRTRDLTDPNGARVLLSDTLWREKIVRDHAEIATYRAEVLQAVSAPDHVARDPNFERRTRYHARGVGPSRWLPVVVS